MAVPKLETVSITETLDYATYANANVRCGDFIYSLGGVLYSSSSIYGGRNTINGYKVESNGQLTQLTSLPNLRRRNNYHTAVSNGNYIYSIGGYSFRPITWTTYGDATQSNPVADPFGGSSNIGVFDGTGDYILTSTNIDFCFHLENWTVEFWIRPTSIGINQVITSMCYGTSGYAQLHVDLTTTNVLRYIISLTGSGWTNPSPYSGTHTLTTGQWYHIAIQRSSDGYMRAWVNGELDYTYNIGSSNMFYGTNQPLCIGARYYNSTSYAPFFGYISNYRISNVARYGTGSTITVPTTAFTTDNNTTVLVKMNGSGATFTESSISPITIEGFQVNPTTGALTRLEGLPTLTAGSASDNFRGCTSISYGNYIYILGGYSNGSSYNTVYCFEVNPSTGALTPVSITGNLATAMSYSQAICLNNHIYLISGYTTTYSTVIQGLTINPSTHNVTQIAGLPSLPASRYIAQIGYDNINGTNDYNIYVMGGYTTIAQSTIYSYKYTNADASLTLQTLTTGTTSLPEVKSHTNAVSIGHRIYVLGGLNITSTIRCFESFEGFQIIASMNNSNWGEISPTGTNYVYRSANQLFTTSDYLSSFTDNSIEKLSELNHVDYTYEYQLNNILENHTITAIASRPPLITPGAKNGSISPNTEQYLYQHEQEYTFTPNSHYELSRIVVDGLDKPLSETYNISNLTKDSYIYAIFKRQPCIHILNTNNQERINIFISESTSHYAGSFTNDTWRNIIPYDSLLFNSNTIAIKMYSPTDGDFIASHVSIVERSGTTSNGITIPTEITFNGSSGFALYEGNNYIVSDFISFSIDTNKDYLLIFDLPTSSGGRMVQINDTGDSYLKHESTSWNSQNMQTPNSLTGYSLGKYDIISRDSLIYVASGDSQEISIVPDSEYEIYKILVDGEDIIISNRDSLEYDFNNVTVDHSIHVIFSEKSKILASSSTNGSISPSGTTYISKFME